MNHTRHKLIGLILLASCGLLSFSAHALYRWVDDEGHVHYGDRVPAEFAKQERKVLSDSGRTIKVYAAAKSPEEIAGLERLEATRKEEERVEQTRARKQAIYDRSLLATYSNDTDMYQVRDGKAAAVGALIQLTHSRIKSMDKRLATLNEEAAGFERSGKELPASLDQQIGNLKKQIKQNKAFIVTKEAEKVEINRQFEKDIFRYRELRAMMDE